MVWRGDLGSKVQLGITYESIEVEETSGRFINTIIGDNTELSNDFVGAEASYHFQNKDNDAFPTLGMQFELQAGYKNNINEENGFGYIISELGFDYKLIPSGQLVLATNLRTHINLGDDFQFYQGATLGANNGLRGYRNERFTGKSSFVQSTDIRWNFTDLKTGILPISLGVYGGIDYGRVWVDGEDSDRWNNSIGGGFFVNLAKMMSANISAFNSDDGMRIAFKMGFGF